MRHIERHTYIVTYNKDKVKFLELQRELKLFRDAWPNAIIDGDTMGEVRVSYENFSRCRLIAEGAILDFRRCVARHDWWEETEC